MKKNKKKNDAPLTEAPKGEAEKESCFSSLAGTMVMPLMAIAFLLNCIFLVAFAFTEKYIEAFYPIP